jgi:Dyp-type peroxidase family
MRFSVALVLSALALTRPRLALGATDAASSAQFASAKALITGHRSTNIFPNIPGQPPLPSPSQAATGGLNTSNIQGDILIGMKKNQELFFFFEINNPALFKAVLGEFIEPFITTTTQLLNVDTQPIVALNVAFTQIGLTTLNVTDNLNDTKFTNGQLVDVPNLGDPGTTNWVPQFTQDNIHGLFLIASDQLQFVDAAVTVIEFLFGSSMTEIYSLQGNVRPGNETGHEHFGFLDGISQPAVTGFGTPLPGQAIVDPGIILLGEEGDTQIRPSWATDGAFLAFRQLKQLVPEFDQYVEDNAPVVENLTVQEWTDLFGARMVGRWKSGAPVDLNPLFDNPAQGANAQENNNFNFTHPGFNFTTDQFHCPFDAHIRKTHPRADLNAPTHFIVRAGIPYGPEVSAQEAASSTTTTERGLAFVAYQSQIANGFAFLQQKWANNPNFIFNKNDTDPGFDPIIGANMGQERFMTGMDIDNFNVTINLPFDFVVSRGGSYLFSPSISALKTVIAA